MLPFIFEWQWDVSHLVFHGGVHFALTVIGAGLGYCILKTIYDTFIDSDHDGSHDNHH